MAARFQDMLLQFDAEQWWPGKQSASEAIIYTHALRGATHD